MNCKPGDLAVIVLSQTGIQLGKVVQCVAVASGQVRYGGRLFNLHSERGPWWQIDREITISADGGARIFHAPFISDKSLRPLRDNDGEDETLTWARRPAVVGVAS